MKNKKKSPNKEKQKKNKLKNYAVFSGIAFEMMAIIGAGSFLGYKLDEKKNNEFPLFTVIFSLSAVIVAIYLVIKSVIKFSKDDDDEKQEKE